MFAKKIVFTFVAFSFIFVAEAFARKSSRHKDDVEKTKISRKLTRGKKREEKKKPVLKAQQKKDLELRRKRQAQLKKAEKKKTLELKKKQKAQLRNRKSTSSQSNRKLQKKKQVQPKKVVAPQKRQSLPRVYKEPTPYYVKVRDLPKDQQKQVAKHMGLKNLSKGGTIKFAHSDLDSQKTPTFQEFLDIIAQNGKSKKKTSGGFKTLEYRDENNSIVYFSSIEYSNNKSNKKESNWSWPWDKSPKNNNSNWAWPWDKSPKNNKSNWSWPWNNN